MHQLSKSSIDRVHTCNTYIQDAVHYVLQFIDVGVLDGHRTEHRQDEYFALGATKVRWPNSHHNAYPSNAVDLCIYVAGYGYIDHNTAPRTYRQYYGYLAGMLKAWSEERNLYFKWGGDWDGDGDFEDQKFNDLVHFVIKAKD